MTALTAVLSCALLFACSEESTTPDPTAQTITRSNMQPDSTIGWLYYSVDGDSVVAASAANTTAWDIRMAYLLCCGQTRQIDVFFNSGTAGPGIVKAMIVNSRYENLTAIPDTSMLQFDDTSATTRIVPVAVIGSDVLFAYDITTHTINPSPDRVLVVRTGKGAIVKFQFTSIYQEAPTTPNLNSPIGYYHFRYAKAVNNKW
jgi:hypothetical protein